MGRRRDESVPVATEEAFAKLTVDHLRPLALLVGSDAPKRKPELVAQLATAMKSPDKVRKLYAQLDVLAQQAVQQAAHHPMGVLQRDKFVARHGEMPAFSHPSEKNQSSSYDYDRHKRPTLLGLFFPVNDLLPSDLRELLLEFVPRPSAFVLPTVDELPAAIKQTWKTWKGNRAVDESQDIPLRVRETAREAEHDLRALLRLTEAGRVRVSDKKRLPTAATQKAVAEVLQGGDFYSEVTSEEWKHDPAFDLTIKAFAWPILLQASKLAQQSGDNLTLTSAGRKALASPAATVLRSVFQKWRSNNLLDEFRRVDVIKGQDKGGLSALSARRQTVLDALAACPIGAWFAVDDFFWFLRGTDRDFVLSHRPYDLYIAEHYYGNLGYDSKNAWEQLQGRYILTVLFEYVATLGLIDIAYAPPQGVRRDFGDRWGSDDLSCLSRYDGLLYVRINPLGAWCLGVAEHCQTPGPAVNDVLQVLPNLEIVVTKPPLPASDRLVLDRFGEPQSEGVWKLTPTKLLAVLEEGGSLDELDEFLSSRSSGRLPQTVAVFLKDQRETAGRLRDLGMVRFIECNDSGLARMLAGDPQLRGKCHLAGDRWLVFRIEDEAAVRRGLRRLRHILPPPRE